MKAEYDFSKATRGKFTDRVPADAVFVQFDPRVSALFDSEGDLATRIRAASARGRRAPQMVRTLALSRTEFSRLRPLLDRLGGKIINENPRRGRRKAG